jgi:hypothetical protein
VLISDSYRELNALLHRDNPAYGVSGHKYAPLIRELVKAYGTKDVLDYGAGKRTLELSLGFPIHNYDPCIPGLDATPQPHDIVACTDVLEHIEPECLDAVLRDIRRCMKTVGFLLVSTRPANKCLPDGRNAHLIQQPYEWWQERFEAAGFQVRQRHDAEGEFGVIVT